MISKIKKIIENKFFKKRIIFVADKTTNVPENLFENTHFICEIVRNIRELPPIEKMNNKTTHIKFTKRLENPSLTLYLALDKTNSQLACYYWIAEAKERPIWHDKIYVEKDSVLGFDAFTLPEYRGKNAFPFLQSLAIKNTVQEGNYKCFYSVVESSNKASLRAHEKLGLKVGGYNYLIKLYGINVFSIIHCGKKREIHYVLGNSKSECI